MPNGSFMPSSTIEYMYVPIYSLTSGICLISKQEIPKTPDKHIIINHLFYSISRLCCNIQNLKHQLGNLMIAQNVYYS